MTSGPFVFHGPVTRLSQDRRTPGAPGRRRIGRLVEARRAAARRGGRRGGRAGGAPVHPRRWRARPRAAVRARRSRRRVARRRRGDAGGQRRRRARGGAPADLRERRGRSAQRVRGVIRRAGVTIAISTSGEAPALAGILREGIDALLPADLERWSVCARSLRAGWKEQQVPMADRRPLLIKALKDLYP